MSWSEEGKTKSKMLFHITDAPGHGLGLAGMSDDNIKKVMEYDY